MDRTQKLNLALQSLKDALGVIASIGNLEDLATRTLPPAQDQALRANLDKVIKSEVLIRALLKTVLQEEDVPVQRASTALLHFYREEFLPKEDLIWRLYDPFWTEILDNIELPAPGESHYTCNVSRTLTYAMDSLETELELNDYINDPDQMEFDIELTRRLMHSVFFEPDEWLSHMDDLTPITCSKDAKSVPRHVRARLREVYRSFVFGNWMACISTSRALLEYVLLDRRSNLGIDAYEDSGDTSRVRRLGNLIDQASAIRPELEEAMKHVQEYGNEVMHPKARSNVLTFVPGKTQAMDCVKKIQHVVSTLYT